MTAGPAVDIAYYAGVTDEEFATWTSVAERVAAELAETALARDRANQNPVAELRLLREAGLLGFAAPRELGGGGGSLTQALKLSRIVSAADGSIGQLLTYHYSNGVWTHILGTPEQRERIARGVGTEGWFQGSVSNPRDPGVTVERDGDGYRITGRRTFATGVAVADLITVLLYGDEPVNVVIPPDRPGLSFGDDWDNLGQRLTASGSVTFDGVVAHADEVLAGLGDGAADRRRDGLRGLFSQLIFAHLYAGIADGALKAAARYVREKGRPWPEAASRDVTEDPYHLQLLGRLSASLAAATALADAASEEFEAALALGADLTEERWGRLAILIDQAKAVTTETVLDVTHNIYQATGARSTANAVGLDIYWRNARTHTTHDPLPYRQREIGRHVLTGELPRPRQFADLAKAADVTQGAAADTATGTTAATGPEAAER
ncbi:acyl-CoA dehydrogenase family protein [Actinomadura nitritigenes]|uniref:acyl-CoA dehydrogenase family protein n=1 Tax=Actinomadura nitritigenes TaxID=134602 RepID=UPI003D8C658D